MSTFNDVIDKEKVVRNLRNVYPRLCYGVIFPTACTTAIPIAVPVYSDLGPPYCSTAHPEIYYYANSNDTDGAVLTEIGRTLPTSSNAHGEEDNGHLPLKIRSQIFTSIPFGKNTLHLDNALHVYYVDQKAHAQVDTNDCVEHYSLSMWHDPCPFNGPIVVMMMSNVRSAEYTQVPQESYSQIATIITRLILDGVLD